jgi:hypothetical protein
LQDEDSVFRVCEGLKLVRQLVRRIRDGADGHISWYAISWEIERQRLLEENSALSDTQFVQFPELPDQQGQPSDTTLA